MTSLYMKSEEEQSVACDAWCNELFAFPGHREMNYEAAAVWLVTRYFEWILPNYNGNTFSISKRYQKDVVTIDIECAKTFSFYTRTPTDCYQVSFCADLSEGIAAINDTKDQALLSVLFKFITAHFDNEITPKMFSLLSEHIAADLDGCLANNDNQGFAERIAKYWKASGAVEGASSGIHERITYGYGCIDNLRLWMIPLPDGEESRQPKLVEFQPSEEMLAKLEGRTPKFPFTTLNDASGKVPSDIIDNFFKETGDK